jgi:hypothetical protein
VDEIVDLSTIIEGLTTDGQSVKISRIHVAIRAGCTEVFSLQPVVVQTAGTVTDTVDQTTGNLDALLASAINDVFGSQVIGNWITSKAKPGSYDEMVEIDFDIPSNVLGILNKETETERLQNLILALVGYGRSVQVTAIDVAYTIYYVLVRKSIILR